VQGFCDTRDPDVMLLRPMRDFMKKEVVFYNVFNKLESVVIPSLGTKVNFFTSEKYISDVYFMIYWFLLSVIFLCII
jgi:cytoplasmic tRNA 2-thiolation protein 2